MDPATILPKFVFQVCVLKKLEVPDLIRCFQVSKKWHSLIPTHLKKEMVLASKVTIGPAHWRRFGDIGEEVELPDDIKEEMQKDCPYFKGQKKYQSSLLVYIPSQINGKYLTISYFTELIRNQQFENSIDLWDNELLMPFQKKMDRVIKNSYWMIFTKKNLPDSVGNNLFKQKKLIKEKYDMAFVLEVIAAIAMTYIFSGERKTILFPKSATLSKDIFCNGNISAGNVDPKGILLSIRSNRLNLGIAAVQRFRVKDEN